MADSRLKVGGPASSTPERPEANERPVFYFDYSSPECWLAAERVNHVLAVVPVWTPVRLAGVRSPRAPSDEELADIERRAAAQWLPAPRLPTPWPEDLDLALRVATFAAAAGRVVAFSLAALRQAFVAGRDLSQIDNVLIAAAACELHPRAVLKGAESRSTEQRLRTASDEAAARGVEQTPAVAAGGHVFHGAAAAEEATLVA